MEDCRLALSRMYYNIFGSNIVACGGVTRDEIRGDEKGGDSLPELENEEADDNTTNDGSTQQRPGPKIQRTIRYDVDELPPAFISNEDYPPGWLVYHPKYGVVMIEKLLELDKI